MKNHLKLPPYITAGVFIVFVVICILPLSAMLILGASGNCNFSFITSFFEERQLILLSKSYLLAISSTILSLVIGIPCGFLMARGKRKILMRLKPLFLAPIFIPPYVHVIAWLHLLAADAPINVFLTRIAHLNSPLFRAEGMTLSAILLAVSYHPFVTLATAAGLNSIPSSIEESALLSMPPSNVLRRITFPTIKPHIIVGAVFVFVFSLANYTVPDLLLVRTYPVELFVRFSARFEEARAMAGGLPLIALTVALITAAKFNLGDRPYITVGVGNNSIRGITPRIGTAAFIFFATILTLTMLIPISDILYQIGNAGTFIESLAIARTEIFTSILLAVAASFLSTFLALLIAYQAVRASGKLSKFMEYGLYSLFAVPATVIGITLIGIWNRSASAFIYDSPAVVLFAHLAQLVSFAFVIIFAGLKSVDRKLEEAYLLTDGSVFRRMVSVILPVTRPAIAASLIICFVLSLGEVGATLLVIPPGMETLPIRIYSLLHYGAEDVVASLCLFLVIISLACGAALIPLWRQKWTAD